MTGCFDELLSAFQQRRPVGVLEQMACLTGTPMHPTRVWCCDSLDDAAEWHIGDLDDHANIALAPAIGVHLRRISLQSSSQDGAETFLVLLRQKYPASTATTQKCVIGTSGSMRPSSMRHP